MNRAHYRKEVFAEQVPLVYSFARHLVHHRALKNAISGKQFPSRFWVDTANAHILQACIYWCMVFGSFNSSKTHWHHLAVGPTDTLRNSFREGLCAHLEITEAEWNIYQKEMVTFRNQYVAHRDFTIQRPVPIFDRAVEVAFFYDSWIRRLIAPDILDEPPLSELYGQLNIAVSLEVTAAVQTTVVEQIIPGNVGR